MKKVLITIIILIAISLIGTGVYLNTVSIPKEKDKQQEEQKEKVEYTDRTTPSKEFPSITTEDNIITLSNITVYYRDEVSAFDVEISSKEDINEVYLLIEFDLETEKAQKTIGFTNLKPGIKIKTQIQVGQDITKATSWSVKRITKEEAKENLKYSRGAL